MRKIRVGVVGIRAIAHILHLPDYMRILDAIRVSSETNGAVKAASVEQ